MVRERWKNKMDREEKIYKEKTMRLAKLLEKILENEDGRRYVATIRACNNKVEELKREIRRLESMSSTAQHKMISKFEISPADWMNMIIAIDMKGIEEILKKHKVDVIVS